MSIEDETYLSAQYTKIIKKNKFHRAEALKRHFTMRYQINGKTKRRAQLLCCNYCEKSFNKTCRFHEHLRIHLDEKPFTCSVCNKGFVQRGNMQRHQDFCKLQQDENIQEMKLTFENQSGEK